MAVARVDAGRRGRPLAAALLPRRPAPGAYAPPAPVGAPSRVRHRGGVRPDPAGEGERMLDRLVHRGPDDGGEVRSTAAGSATRACPSSTWTAGASRSSTRSGTSGSSATARSTTTTRSARGSRRRLRDPLGQRGRAHLLDERGPEALDELEGMYAFLVAGDDGGLHRRARDPVGIKPLYWARRGGEVRFASEMRAFEPEWREHVEAFPPGHHWTPDAASALRPRRPARPRRGGRAERRCRRAEPAPRRWPRSATDSSRRCAASSWATCRSACSSPAAWTRR